MELFGRTLDAQQVAGLVFLLTALVWWGIVLRGEMAERRWVKRRQKELQGTPAPPKGPDRDGPWG